MEKNTTEITKLTERIAKDPKSKLFVPLAEEYKKSGDIEMAIQVLTDGLRSNPGYVTARSFLGRLLLDKGDLTGAQNELEEVIKAIPDNLLAQRKLGDLYVLQGRGSDALQRYKAAYTLNPADKELPSLLADLEAGRDISARIPSPKSAVPPSVRQPSPAAALQTQAKSAPAITAKPAASPPAPPTAALRNVPPVAPASPKKEVAPVAAAETVAAVEIQPAPTAPPAPVTRDEAEVIEDIVEIELLEHPAPAAPANEIKVPDLDNAAKEQPDPDATVAETSEMPAFDLSEIPTMTSTDAEDLTALAWGTETFAVLETNIPAETVAAGDESGDDLNTNTLAELYISQGFYDKAIEIYEGMLGERPENKALQQKIETLRAIAGTAVNDVDAIAVAAPVTGEHTSVAPAFVEPQVPVEAQEEVSNPVKETPQPPEPMLVEDALVHVVTETVPDSVVARSPQAATMRRKETIDRLESWLQKIMKEKK
jgi:tetratricopeptide (TPR) repeat protein